MKLMIASDIHGSAKFCRQMLQRFAEEKADRLLLLGDVLYHGPRNDLPEEYAPKQVIAMLNERKNVLCCVRGNCDTEVDQMVLEFPILSDFSVIPVGKRLLYATHGHHNGETNPPPLCEGDLLLCGHTHVPKCADHGSFIYLNPGSVSIPKEGSCHSYMTLEDGTFLWKNVETGEEYRSFTP